MQPTQPTSRKCSNPSSRCQQVLPEHLPKSTARKPGRAKVTRRRRLEKAVVAKHSTQQPRVRKAATEMLEKAVANKHSSQQRQGKAVIERLEKGMASRIPERVKEIRLLMQQKLEMTAERRSVAIEKKAKKQHQLRKRRKNSV